MTKMVVVIVVKVSEMLVIKVDLPRVYGRQKKIDVGRQRTVGYVNRRRVVGKGRERGRKGRENCRHADRERGR